MEIESTSKINSKISEFICNKKGIINLGYIADSQRLPKILNNNSELVSHLADMIIQSSENSKYYSTIILNYEQYEQSITDKRFMSMQDKSYSNFIDRSFEMKGVNFKEGDDIQIILEGRFSYMYDIISFKVNFPLFTDNIMDEDEAYKAKALRQEYEQKLIQLVQNIKLLYQEQDDLIFMIDFDLQHVGVSAQQDAKETLKGLEKTLYTFCAQTLLTNDIPLENVIISLNLATIGCKNILKAKDYMDEAAFNTLLTLSHCLPPSVGGVVLTFDGILDLNTFARYLSEMNHLSVLKYFPTTFMTHASAFEYLAERWKGRDNAYMATLDYFSRCSEAYEAGLNGHFKLQPDEMVIGVIESGDLPPSY